MGQKIIMEEMTWAEVQEALDDGRKTAIIACGATEEHGPMTPLSTDTLLGQYIAVRTAEQLGDALVAPPISVGSSWNLMDFAGTITLRDETLMEVLRDYYWSLEHHGFKTIVFIQQHGSNGPAMQAVINKLGWERGKARALHVIPWSYVPPGMGPLFNKTVGYHANSTETAMVMAVRPDLVYLDRAVVEQPEVPDIHDTGMRFVLQTSAPFKPGEGGVRAISKSGGFGRPMDATLEFGQKLLDGIIENLVADLRKVTLRD